MMLSSRLERRRRRVSKEKDPRAHDDDDQQGADHGEPQGVDTARLSLLLVLVFFLQVFFVLAFLFVVLVVLFLVVHGFSWCKRVVRLSVAEIAGLPLVVTEVR
jgi:hypothetical protein